MPDDANDPTLLFEEGYTRVRRCRRGRMLYFTNDTYIGRSLDLYGEFSEGEVAMFDHLLRPDMTALDIGANFGCHTVFMARKVGLGGRVYAFEPQRIIYQALCANLAMNAVRNTYALHAAADAETGEVWVPGIDYSVAGNFGGVALGSYDQGERVEVNTIDSLQLQACHLIKVDVEGMENEVLEGGRETLAKFQPFLYVENDRLERSPELIERLLSAGYRLFWHRTKLFNPDNFLDNEENVFGETVSVNVVCVPRSSGREFANLPEITGPEGDA